MQLGLNEMEDAMFQEYVPKSTYVQRRACILAKFWALTWALLNALDHSLPMNLPNTCPRSREAHEVTMLLKALSGL